MRAHRVTVAFLSILLLGAAAARTELDPAQRTMILMRVAGSILSAHQEFTENLLPEGQIGPVSATLSRLDPEIARWMPTKDGWGNPLRVAEDGWLYVISYGADGREDVPYA